jgi:cell wall-associated NlpC family hydrolase
MKMRSIRREWKWRHIIFLSLLLATTACRSIVRTSRPSEPKLPERELKRTGFAIQVGAFSIVDNAIRLTRSLNRKGLNAYYFAHTSGLYKVRFGDFRSRKAAQKKAQRLAAAGNIDDYYIVSPEEYTVTKRSKYGIRYVRNEIVATAKRFLGIPYSWGGSSPYEGFDCSGLTIAVYKLNGLNLPRSSREQYKTGTPVKKSRLLKGDLVFFATSKGRKVTHVGIYVGNNKFIHAPGRNKHIRTDSLSETYFMKRYKGARTYLK